MEQVKINELIVGGPTNLFLMIESVSVKQKKSGDKYLNFVLKDRSGKISANYWSPSRAELGAFAANDIVYVESETESYADKLQLNIKKIRKTQESDGVGLADFIKSSPKSGEAMYREVLAYIEKYVENEDLKKLTLAIYEDHKEQLLTWPAAISFHHAELGGLLRHTIGVMRGCFYMYQAYRFLNKDLLLCGAALHDIGKLSEYVANDTGLLKEMTVDGALVSHIIRGAMLVEDYGKRLGTDSEALVLLTHMILSHHGKPEFGSSVTPRIPEAFILHEMDDIDAKIYEMEDALAKVKEGTLTDRQRAFDDARLYRSPMLTVGEEFI